jgi:sulfate adenylyltransferase
MVAMERGKYYLSGELKGLNKPIRDFPCKTPLEVYILHQYTHFKGCLRLFFKLILQQYTTNNKVRAELPKDKDVIAFQCRNPIHRAHYELFIRSLEAENVGKGAVVMVHPTCGPTQAGDIDGEPLSYMYRPQSPYCVYF